LTNVALAAQNRRRALPAQLLFHTACIRTGCTALFFSACTGTTTHDFIIEKTDEFCKSFPAKSAAGFYGHAELTGISTALCKTVVKFLSILP
jgi:hypothetical protein